MKKILILTTDTSHHAYFVQKLSKTENDIIVISETRHPKAPNFPIYHHFEDEMIVYENSSWFNGKQMYLNNFSDTFNCFSINDDSCLNHIKKYSPDITFVFGTSILKPLLINSINKNLLNFHGGDPERYRGLDSHLWSIYHDDYKSIVSTLHFVEKGIDTGDIVYRECIKISRNLKIHQLRKENTEKCVSLALKAIDKIKNYNNLNRKKQKNLGRYYSYMPLVLKNLCVKKFNNKQINYNYDS